MQIIKSEERYLAQLVVLFEEYRVFCEFEPAPEQTEVFLKNLMDKEESVLFIAIEPDTDKVMGFVNLYPSYSTLALQRLWILNDLAVSVYHRGKGVSKALIERVLAFAKETHAVRIELKTGKDNLRARQLYETMNFTVDNDNIYYRVPQ